MSDTRLTVLVRSFSFKKSRLTDATGHGIGFVFDMRCVNNPGRIDAMKTLSGKDSLVIEYLEQKTTMPEYLDSVKHLVDLTVRNYLDRGFSYLTINFGCTGGQHRSVYAAETIAHYIQDHYPVVVSLIHLEEDNWVR
ncbi:MAG: hypothetical protein J5I59_02665 [Saprospiraceae bacterium]|nr:hypothetical protein [Saprospiraceae bacterium]